MKVKQWILMTLVFLLSTGCVSDLNFDDNVGETKLVVFSKFNTDSLVVALSTSTPSDNNSFQIPDLQSAEITIADDNGSNWNLGFKRKQGDRYYFTDEDFFPQPDKIYHLNIDQDKYLSVKAESYIPKKPEPLDFEIEILEKDSIVVGSQKIERVKFSYSFQLENNTNEDAFFGLNVIAIMNDTLSTQPPNIFEYPVQINTNSVESENISYNLVSRNLQFQWDKVENPEGRFNLNAELWLPSFSISNKKKIKGFEVSFEAQTEDLFLFFQQAKIQYLLSEPDVPIINEPVILYTNIENGLGYFSGYNELRDTILLP